MLLLAYLIYTVVILTICFLLEWLRYKLLFGYCFGTILGLMSLLIFDLEIAIAISVFAGLIATAKIAIFAK